MLENSIIQNARSVKRVEGRGIYFIFCSIGREDGREELLNIAYSGEDDITLSDENMEPCGCIEDFEVVSFLPAERRGR